MTVKRNQRVASAANRIYLDLGCFLSTKCQLTDKHCIDGVSFTYLGHCNLRRPQCFAGV